MTKRIAITSDQLESLTQAATYGMHELSRFLESPRVVLTRLAAEFDLELSFAPSVPLPAAAAELEPLPRTEPLPLVGGAAAVLGSSSSSSPSTVPEGRRRSASPQEVEGHEDLLRGRRGKVLHAAGPGSWVVELDDGVQVVLPENALYLTGAEAPKPELLQGAESDARVEGWKELIAGRRGHYVGRAGEGSHTVAFSDGQQITLPEAALPFAGVDLPGK